MLSALLILYMKAQLATECDTMGSHNERRPSPVVAAVIICVIAALLVGAYFGGRWLELQSVPPETRSSLPDSAAQVGSIEVDGVLYMPRRNLNTILLMGIDRDVGPVGRIDYRHGGQADFLRLLVIDKAEKTVTQIEIDRDTMTPVTMLGVLGDRAGVRTVQICVSHSFGDGGKQNCELAVEAVSNLLCGVTIDDYIALNLDSVPVINDLVGGVPVTLEDDFTSLDPTMKQGASIVLQGRQAEHFVRGRMTIGVGTNESRMRRQNVFVAGLTERLRERMTSESFVSELIDTMTPYMVTDMKRGTLVNRVWAARDYSARMAQIAGEHRVGTNGFTQFWADEEAIRQLVLDVFYEAVPGQAQ